MTKDNSYQGLLGIDMEGRNKFQAIITHQLDFVFTWFAYTVVWFTYVAWHFFQNQQKSVC